MGQPHALVRSVHRVVRVDHHDAPDARSVACRHLPVDRGRRAVDLDPVVEIAREGAGAKHGACPVAVARNIGRVVVVEDLEVHLPVDALCLVVGRSVVVDHLARGHHQRVELQVAGAAVVGILTGYERGGDPEDQHGPRGGARVVGVLHVGLELAEHGHPAGLFIVGASQPEHAVLAGARKARVVDEVGLYGQVGLARGALDQRVQRVVAPVGVGAALRLGLLLAAGLPFFIDSCRPEIEMKRQLGQERRRGTAVEGKETAVDKLALDGHRAQVLDLGALRA